MSGSWDSDDDENPSNIGLSFTVPAMKKMSPLASHLSHPEMEEISDLKKTINHNEDKFSVPIQNVNQFFKEVLTESNQEVQFDEWGDVIYSSQISKNSSSLKPLEIQTHSGKLCASSKDEKMCQTVLTFHCFASDDNSNILSASWTTDIDRCYEKTLGRVSRSQNTITYKIPKEALKF